MSATQTNSKDEKVNVSSSAAQQGDNIAHALAGAGGGLLSMTLTSVLASQIRPHVKLLLI